MPRHQPRILTVPGPAVSGPVDGAGGRVVYWSWRETSGASTATFRLWDSSSNQGTMVATFQLDAAESIREFPGFYNLPYRVGLYLEIISGTIEGQITVIPWREDDGECGIPVIVVGQLDVEFNEFGGGQ